MRCQKWKWSLHDKGHEIIKQDDVWTSPAFRGCLKVLHPECHDSAMWDPFSVQPANKK